MAFSPIINAFTKYYVTCPFFFHQLTRVLRLLESGRNPCFPSRVET